MPAPFACGPILMTSIATMSSAVPDGTRPWARFRSARSHGGGVARWNFISTIFTLYVVPCAHSSLAQFDKPREDFPDELPVAKIPRERLIT